MEAKFAALRQQRLQQGDSYAEEEQLQLQFVSHPEGHAFTLQSPGPQGAVSFDVLLSMQFPLRPPRVTCTTHFVRPSIADGRDLLPSILEAPWTPQTPLTTLVSALPGFLVRPTQTRIAATAPEELGNIGCFHLGEALPLSLWNGLTSMGVFRCLEIDPHNPKLVRERFFVITELSVLQLDPSKSLKGFGYLTAHSSFSVLAGCSSVYSEEDRLNFQWRPCGSMPPAMQLFKFQNVKECLVMLEANMAAAGVKVTKQTIRPRPTLREEEVTSVAMKKVKIEKVLSEIKKKEAKLEKQINRDAVTTLMSLIQQAIEYFSAVDDSRSDEYLGKLRSLLQREDVQKILMAIDEPVKTETTAAG